MPPLFNAQDDPLGIGLRERARQRREGLYAQGYRDPINMLRDPGWDAMFQAWGEGGVSRVGDESVGVKRGQFDPTPALTSTIDPGTISAPSPQVGVNARRSPSNALGVTMPLPRSSRRGVLAGPGSAISGEQFGFRGPATSYGNQQFDVGGGPPMSTTYGADAEIDRLSRQAVVRDLNDYLMPDVLKQQRANILSHGTIEQPDVYKRRRGLETLAEDIAPMSPVRRAEDLEQGRKMDLAYQQNVRPTEITTAAGKELAEMQEKRQSEAADVSIAGADIGAEADRYSANVAGLANVLGRQYVDPEERAEAIRSFMSMLMQLRGLR